MSVMLSHIDLNAQDDDEEAELEREDEKQQEELKAFLDEELGNNDLFDESFVSNQSNFHQSRNGADQQQSSKNMKEEQHGNHNKEDYLSVINNNGEFPPIDFHDPKQDVNGWQPPTLLTGYYDQNQKYLNNYGDDSEKISHNADLNNYQFHDENYVMLDRRLESLDRGGYPGDFEEDDNELTENGKQYSQLQVLYFARGRKIENLQKEMETNIDNITKENRVLKHKLTLCSGEKEGLKSSVEQLQALLQEEKNEYLKVQQLLDEERNKNRILVNQVHEYEEKLLASEETIDSLQQQVQLMQQSDSLSKARSQHESMLATMRKKHEEDILSLKQKLDDMKQSLAWKTEDVNRYREMLDSNSTASEVGMLRHRLSNEETMSKNLRSELEKKSKDVADLEEQLSMYEILMKTTNQQQFSSTPFPAADMCSMNKGPLSFKTPITKIRQQMTSENLCTPKYTESSSLRGELVIALSKNHVKRKEITSLRDEINNLNLQLCEEKQAKGICDKSPVDVIKDQLNAESCQNCQNYLQKLKQQESDTAYLKTQLENVKIEKVDLQNNMADLVKTFDRKKIEDLESQSTAMLQLVDDAKDSVRTELLSIHSKEKEHWDEEYSKLSSELLYTKEEYVKLSEEVKHIEEKMKHEREELKLTLDAEYQNRLKIQENQLTSQYLEDLDKEKLQWKSNAQSDENSKIQHAITLAQAQWEIEKTEEISMALKAARAEWEIAHSTENANIGEKIDKIKEECSHQQKLLYEKSLEEFINDWNDSKKLEFDKQLKSAVDEFGEKQKQNIQEEHGECQRFMQSKETSLREEIKKLEEMVLSQKQQLDKADVELNLKQSLFARQEEHFRYTIGLLKDEAEKLKLKVPDVSDGVNRSQTSIIFDKIVDISNGRDVKECDGNVVDGLWKQKELGWKRREEELIDLLKEATRTVSSQNDSVFNDTLINKLNNVSGLSSGCKRETNLSNNSRNAGNHAKDDLNNTHHKEHLSQTINNYTSKIELLSKENSDLRSRETQLEALLEELKQSHTNELQKIEKEFLSYKYQAERHEENMIKEKDHVTASHKHEMEMLIERENEKLKRMKNQHYLEIERLKNNILVDISDQQSTAVSAKQSYIDRMKEEHTKELHRLKKNFREKLERISDMKKRWVDDEERNRRKLQETIQREFEMKISNLQSEHAQTLSFKAKQFENTYNNMASNHQNELSRNKEECKSEIKEMKDKHDLVEINLKKEHREATTALIKKHNVMEIKFKNEESSLKKVLLIREQELKMEREKHNEILLGLKSMENVTSEPYHNKKSTNNQSKAKYEMNTLDKMRRFYLESLKNIQRDFNLHVLRMREKAKEEIAETVKKVHNDIIDNLRKERNDVIDNLRHENQIQIMERQSSTYLKHPERFSAYEIKQLSKDSHSITEERTNTPHFDSAVQKFEDLRNVQHAETDEGSLQNEMTPPLKK